ncbi:MAG TPA: HEAT repeat domain-containing protein [Pirellulales bacterium]|jgi:hypothetical protein|nr:HEAT repeat domain-containing protein [Pirellulales bacterium]
MDDERQQPPSSENPYAFTAANDLPAIEPPSMKFIVQLFVVPGVIVAAIVLAWFLITQITQTTRDPHTLIEALRRTNESRWQAANNIAEAMNNPKGVAFRKDASLAKELAQILADDLKNDSTTDAAITFRYYLSRALGGFAVPDALPILLTAAKQEKREQTQQVCIAAINGIAALIANIREFNPSEKIDNPDLLPTLIDLSKSSDPLIRSNTAYTLGVLGGTAASERLRAMLHDGYSDVRYNAAAGLARYGDDTGKELILEMLNPDATASVELEKMPGMGEEKRFLLYESGLRAAMNIGEHNPTADLTPYIDAGEDLVKALSGKPSHDARHVVDSLRELSRHNQAMSKNAAPAKPADAQQIKPAGAQPAKPAGAEKEGPIAPEKTNDGAADAHQKTQPAATAEGK